MAVSGSVHSAQLLLPRVSRVVSEHQARAMASVSSSQILDRINNIVQRHALVSDKYDTNNKVVEFEHPKNLFKLLPLEIGRDGLGDQELEQIRWCRLLLELMFRENVPI